MKKGQIVTGIVERVDFPNKGIVNTDDGACVVKNALPGQRVKAGINKVRKGKAEGRLLEVEESSPDEIGSPCPHFGECGGCTYLSLPYEKQLAVKEAQVKRLLDSVLDKQASSWTFEGIKGSPVQYGYRNKMEFSFGDAYKDGPLSLGMHKRGSFYDIVSVTDCQIVDEDYRKILRMTQEHFDGCSFYHRLRHEGFLRHLLVRKAKKTGELLVALVTTSEGVSPLSEGSNENPKVSAAHETEDHARYIREWKEKLLELPLDGTIAGILHILNDSVADVVQSDETRVLYGREDIEEELLGLKFKISTFSFFQTNSLGAEVLYETAREYVGDLTGEENASNGKVVYDLYSGTGTIAQLMAPVAKKVIGVEIVEEAVEAAKANAKLNDLHNCEFIAGDVLKVLDTIEEKPDMIIVDPPRDGIHPKALGKIIAYNIPKLVYISCKPTSLVRDLEVFLESGYEVEKACCVDQFPWTANIETVALLSKGVVDSKKVKVDFSLEDMDLSEFMGKATYEQVKAYVLEHTGLKVSSLYIAQTKKKCGLDVGENFNLPKSENARQPQCTPEKEDAIMQAFKHFGII